MISLAMLPLTKGAATPEPVAIRAVLAQTEPSILMAVPVAAIRSSIIPEIIWMIFLMVFSEASKERDLAVDSTPKASARRILRIMAGSLEEGAEVAARKERMFWLRWMLPLKKRLLALIR